MSFPGAIAGTGGAGRYIVVLKDSADPGSTSRDHARSYGVEVSYVYRGAEGILGSYPDARVDEVRSDSRVNYVAADRDVSIAAQTLPTGINRIDGELSSTVSGNGSGSVNVDVAAIDTGIDIDHPDLNVVGGMNCSTGRSFDDSNGHGSHVAGTIAAKDDAQGVVGVAPGARLHAVRVLNPQAADPSRLLSAASTG